MPTGPHAPELLRANPSEVGLAPGLPERLEATVDRHIAEGLTDGMQVLVARYGCVAVDLCLGRVAGGDRPIEADTRFHVFSASKPVTAVAVHILAERGELTYADRVARFIPAFAGHGKDAVTIHHLFCHQAGIPDHAWTVPFERHISSDGGIPEICDLPLEYPPGERVVYHPVTGFAMLAAIVERIDGRPFDVFCADEILEPLGMTRTTWRLPADLEPEATDILGADDAMEDEVRIWRTREVRDAVIPAGGLHSTARDLARLYLMLAGGGRLGEVRILSPATVAHAVRLHAPMAPGWGFGFGYGFMVGAQAGVLLRHGSLSSDRAFGHPGMCSAQAFCDPVHDLVVVLLANRAPDQETNDRRMSILSDAVYQGVVE